MLLADTLVVIGMATVSLGTIHETDGIQERSFWLRNDGQHSVVLQQGYTSCGCTKIDLALHQAVAPGDSTRVTLRFNPRHKGGEFHETGTVVYGDGKRKRVELAMTGTCITSEETLLKQFPIRISNELRVSSNRFDLGIMHVGDSKERSIVVLHRDENNRKERVPITFTVDAKTPKGLQHIVRKVATKVKGKKQTVNVTFDVLIK